MTEQATAPQSIVELLDLRYAVQSAARLNYARAIEGKESDYPAYDDIPVSRRRTMENGLLPLVCAIAGPIARAAYDQGRAQGETETADDILAPAGSIPHIDNPYETAVNPFAGGL
jgi:hypothetical protein